MDRYTKLLIKNNNNNFKVSLNNSYIIKCFDNFIIFE